jgi:hypothetical protein
MAQIIPVIQDEANYTPQAIYKECLYGMCGYVYVVTVMLRLCVIALVVGHIYSEHEG